MYFAISGVSTLENFFNLLGLLVIFILILVATYFTARWVGAYQVGQNKNKNMKVIETYRINQTKFIQIVKIANKYIVIAVSKDHIEFLTELTEEDIMMPDENPRITNNFKDIFSGIIEKEIKGKRNKNN
jgi:flagellar protein FliO/FliZ